MNQRKSEADRVKGDTTPARRCVSEPKYVVLGLACAREMDDGE